MEAGPPTPPPPPIFFPSPYFFCQEGVAGARAMISCYMISYNIMPYIHIYHIIVVPSVGGYEGSRDRVGFVDRALLSYCCTYWPPTHLPTTTAGKKRQLFNAPLDNNVVAVPCLLQTLPVFGLFSSSAGYHAYGICIYIRMCVRAASEESGKTLPPSLPPRGPHVWCGLGPRGTTTVS